MDAEAKEELMFDFPQAEGLQVLSQFKDVFLINASSYAVVIGVSKDDHPFEAPSDGAIDRTCNYTGANLPKCHSEHKWKKLTTMECDKRTKLTIQLRHKTTGQIGYSTITDAVVRCDQPYLVTRFGNGT